MSMNLWLDSGWTVAQQNKQKFIAHLDNNNEATVNEHVPASAKCMCSKVRSLGRLWLNDFTALGNRHMTHKTISFQALLCLPI